MNYWNVLKYALMVLFALILIVGVMATDSTPTNQQIVPQTGSKFNL